MSDWIPARTRQRLADEREAKATAQSTDLPIFAPHNGTETSKAAARKVEPFLNGYRKQVLTALMFAPNGLTRAELVPETGLLENTVNGRCRELVEAGYAHEQGERDGRKVVHITPVGLAALEQKAA